jgi:Peptidase family M1 domain
MIWTVLMTATPVRAQTPPADLPRYDMAIRFDTKQKIVTLRERVTWTNRHARPADELVFTIYPLYTMPSKDLAVLAKTVELLREAPSVALLGDPSGKLGRVRLADRDLAFVQHTDIATAVSVALPTPVAQGQSVTVELEYELKLPNKQGRWGYWDDTCYLANWFPQLAVYDDAGWHPTPFIPWHQPYFHEAGLFSATVTLPKDQVLAAGAQAAQTIDRPDGWKDIVLAPTVMRDFCLVSSHKFQEWTDVAAGVNIRVLALPEHAYYAQEALKIAVAAMTTYSQWFGPYPFPQFTVAESYFPWNGNECAGMVLLDHRVFQTPHLADGYVDYLLSHEICHQWWYNLVGTNGYAETFMDEGPATYFSHRLIDRKRGKNNTLLTYPKGLGWLPNINRESYRYSGWYGAVLRDESSPAVQPIDSYRHIFDLFSGAYDRGSRIWGMIEDQLGEAAFMDFSRLLVRKYSFRILRVADFQRELEEYTGRSWDEFFRNWVTGPGVVDWKLSDVKVTNDRGGGSHVELNLRQTKQIDQPTVLGVRYQGADGFSLRIPIVPGGGPLKLNDPPTEVEQVGDHLIHVKMDLPQPPQDLCVDPDNVLPDANPANNHWHTPIHWRVTPLYTQLDDAGIVNDYDRWTIQAGPWLYAAASREPWYTRSVLAGLRVGVVRPENFVGGTYFAYRTDFRDFVVGVDGEWDHFPWPKTALGFHVEKRVVPPFGADGPNDVTRAVVYNRYTFAYSSSTYLDPIHYAEAFATYFDNALPFSRFEEPGTIRPEHTSLAGLHYSLNLLTPYWDPEGGFRADATVSGGSVYLDKETATSRIDGEFTYVKTPPSCLGWFSHTHLAARVAGAVGWPEHGLYYALGGSTLFRGFDLAERQGNAFWVVNLEWRIPIVRNVEWDVCDHLAGLRAISLAAFYDVGCIYADGQQIGPVAHAIGGGLRYDMAVFSFLERFVLRLDVAKTLNEASPVQVWFGVQHAF